MSGRVNSLLAVAISAFFIGLSGQPAVAQQNCAEAQARNSSEPDQPERTDSYVCADNDSGDQTIAQGDLPSILEPNEERAFGGAIIGGNSLSLINNADIANNQLATNFLRGGMYALNSTNFNIAHNSSINLAGLIGILVENSSGEINIASGATIDAATAISVDGSERITLINNGTLTATASAISFKDVLIATILNAADAEVSGDVHGILVEGGDSLSLDNRGTVTGGAAEFAIMASASSVDITNTGTIGAGQAASPGLNLTADQVNLSNGTGASIGSSVISLNIGSSTASVSNAGTISGLDMSGLLDTETPQRLASVSISNDADGVLSESISLSNLLVASIVNDGSIESANGDPISADVDTLLLNNSGSIQSSDTAGDVLGVSATVSDVVLVNNADASIGMSNFKLTGNGSSASSFTNNGEMAALDISGTGAGAEASVINSGRLAGDVLVDGVATAASDFAQALHLHKLSAAALQNSGTISAVVPAEMTNPEGKAGVGVTVDEVSTISIDNTAAGVITGSSRAIAINNVEDATVSNQGSLSIADMTTATSGAAIEMVGMLDAQSNEPISSFLLTNTGTVDGKSFLAVDLEGLASASISNSGSLLREGGFVAQVSDTDRITLTNSGQAVSAITDPVSTRFGVDLAGRNVLLTNTADGVMGESLLTLDDNALAAATVTNEGRLAKLNVATNSVDTVNGAGFLTLNNSGQMDLRVADGEGGESGSVERALDVNSVASVSVTNSGNITVEGTPRGLEAPDSEQFDGVALSATIGRLFALSNEMSGTIEGASVAVEASAYGEASVTNAGSISAAGNDDSVAVQLTGDRTRTQTVGSGESATTAPFATASVSNSGDIHGSDLAVNIDNWQSVTVGNSGNLTSDRTAAVQVNADQLTVNNDGLILGGNEDDANASSALLALDAMITEAVTLNNNAEGSMGVARVLLDANNLDQAATLTVTNTGEMASIFAEDIGTAANSEFTLTNSGSIEGLVDGQSAGEIAAGIEVENFATVVVTNSGSIKGNGAPENFGDEQNPMPVLIGEGVVLGDVADATITNETEGQIFGRNVGLAMFDVATANIVNAGTVSANNFAIEFDNFDASTATVSNTGDIRVLGGIDLSTAMPGFENAAIIANDMTALTVNHVGGSIMGDLFAGAGTEDTLNVENASMAQAVAGAGEQLIRGFETIEFDGAVEFLSATSVSNSDNALTITQNGTVTLHNSFTAAGSYTLMSEANLIFRIDDDTSELADGSLMTVDSLTAADDAVITFSVNDANYFIEEGDSRSYQLISLTMPADSGIGNNQVLVDSVLVKLEEDSISSTDGLALAVVPITIEDYLDNGATQAEANVGIAAREALFGANSSVADNDPVKLRMQEANREGFSSLIDFFESLLTDTSGRTVNTAGASLFAAQNNIRGRSAGLAGGISSGSAMAESGWWVSALNIDFEQTEKDGHEGFEGDGSGFTLGIDHWFNRDLNVGIAGSVLNSDTESESGNDSLETDGNLISLYTTGRLINGFLLHTQITSATYDNESVREVGGTKAEANYEADQMAVSVLLSRPITSGNWQWTPSASLSWSELDIPAYQESGSSAALAVDGQTYNENLIGLGLAVAYVHQANNGNWFLPRLRVDVMHDAAGDDVEVTSRFLVGGQRFVAPGVEHEAMRVSASTGFQWLIGNYSSVDFDLNYYQSGDYESTSVEAKLRYEF